MPTPNKLGTVKQDGSYVFITKEKIFLEDQTLEVNNEELLKLVDSDCDFQAAINDFLKYMIDINEEISDNQQKVIRFSFFSSVITVLTTSVILPELTQIRGLPIPIIAIVDKPGGGKTSQLDFWLGVFEANDGKKPNLLRSDLKNSEFKKKLDALQGSFLFIDDFYETHADTSRTRMGGKELIMREIFAGERDIPTIVTGEVAAVEKFNRSIASRVLSINLNEHFKLFGTQIKAYARQNCDKNISAAIFSKYIPYLLHQINTSDFRGRIKAAREDVHIKYNDMCDRDKDMFFILSLSLDLFCSFLKKEGIGNHTVDIIVQRKDAMRKYIFCPEPLRNAEDIDIFYALLQEIINSSEITVSSVFNVEEHCTFYAKSKYTEERGLCKIFTDRIENAAPGTVFSRGVYDEI